MSTTASKPHPIDGNPIPTKEKADLQWAELSKILSGYCAEWTTTEYAGAVNPRIPHTALLGNGNIGISSDGNDTVKQYRISKSDFWEYGACPLPVGVITIEASSAEKNAQISHDFSEIEDILNARIVTKQTIAGQPLQMEGWMSAVNDLFVVKITSSAVAETCRISVTLEALVNGERPVTAEMRDGISIITRSTQKPAVENENTIAIPYVSQTAIASRIIGANIISVSCSDSAVVMTVDIPASGSIYIVSAVCGGGRTYDICDTLWEGRREPACEAIELLNSAVTAEDLEQLYTAHREWWKNYWLQSYISLDTSDPDIDIIQKYYYAAQYLLGSGVRNGCLAAGLYGIWHTADYSMWRNDYHLNYNFIATFYGICSGNRPSMMLPAAEAIMEYVPVGIERASKLGSPDTVWDHRDSRMKEFAKELTDKGQIDPERGIPDAVIYPVSILPYGMESDYTYCSETLCAPFSVCPMIDYYRFTKDRKFMKETLYVYLGYVLNFLEKWLVKEDDGRYALYAAYNEDSWAKNSALELMAYKLCLKYGIEIAQELGESEKAVKWQSILNCMAEQPVIENYKNSGKTVLGLSELHRPQGSDDWLVMDDLNLSHGNTLPLEALVPFGLFGYYSTDRELKIIQNTIDVYGRDNDCWMQINSFPKVYPAAVNSRYDIRIIVNKLADTIRGQMQPNMMIDDNYHGIEKAGCTEAIHHMMLLCDKGVIKLFGNWFEDKDAHFVRLRAPGAFIFTATYNGNAREIENDITVFSEEGGTVSIASPWKCGMTVVDENNNVVPTRMTTAPNHPEETVYVFDTECGKTYTLRKLHTLKESEKKRNSTR